MAMWVSLSDHVTLQQVTADGPIPDFVCDDYFLKFFMQPFICLNNFKIMGGL